VFLEHFGLEEQPFGVTPDPRFLYFSDKHREALASLVYGTETDRGFLALIAKPGMGKTSLLVQYLEHYASQGRTCHLFQPNCSANELLSEVLRGLGIDSGKKDAAQMRDSLNQVLLEEMAAGRRFLLVIDEAQNLSDAVLESVRLLSNFETPTKKLMHIVLAGQPQLAERLAKPSMTQLRQRISAVIRVDPFTPQETYAYIEHRLRVAGYQGVPFFTDSARALIAEHSEGIPRNINNLCFNAMSLAYATDAKQVDSKAVREVISDLEIESLASGTAPITQSVSPIRMVVPPVARPSVLKQRRYREEEEYASDPEAERPSLPPREPAAAAEESVPLPESEWRQADRRMELWLEEFRGSDPASGPARGGGWFSKRKFWEIRWVVGATAALLIIGSVVFTQRAHTQVDIRIPASSSARIGLNLGHYRSASPNMLPSKGTLSTQTTSENGAKEHNVSNVVEPETALAPVPIAKLPSAAEGSVSSGAGPIRIAPQNKLWIRVEGTAQLPGDGFNFWGNLDRPVIQDGAVLFARGTQVWGVGRVSEGRTYLQITEFRVQGLRYQMHYDVEREADPMNAEISGGEPGPLNRGRLLEALTTADLICGDPQSQRIAGSGGGGGRFSPPAKKTEPQTKSGLRRQESGRRRHDKARQGTAHIADMPSFFNVH